MVHRVTTIISRPTNKIFFIIIHKMPVIRYTSNYLPEDLTSSLPKFSGELMHGNSVERRIHVRNGAQRDRYTREYSVKGKRSSIRHGNAQWLTRTRGLPVQLLACAGLSHECARVQRRRTRGYRVRLPHVVFLCSSLCRESATSLLHDGRSRIAHWVGLMYRDYVFRATKRPGEFSGTVIVGRP